MRKILFRGFHPDENGKTVITLTSGKIHGRWVYWNIFGVIVDPATMEKTFYPNTYCDMVDQMFIYTETVGQWVTTDKNGKDVFAGDIVSTSFDGEYAEGVVVYKERELQYLIQFTEFERCPNLVGCTFHTIRTDIIELISNIFESEVKE